VREYRAKIEVLRKSLLDVLTGASVEACCLSLFEAAMLALKTELTGGFRDGPIISLHVMGHGAGGGSDIVGVDYGRRRLSSSSMRQRD
jgi:hypothetical protein